MWGRLTFVLYSLMLSEKMLFLLPSVYYCFNETLVYEKEINKITFICLLVRLYTFHTLFFNFLSRYNWHTTFSFRCTTCWFMYILRNEYHNKFNFHHHTVIDFFFLWWEPLIFTLLAVFKYIVQYYMLCTVLDSCM